jgi:hypothetical protein
MQPQPRKIPCPWDRWMHGAWPKSVEDELHDHFVSRWSFRSRRTSSVPCAEMTGSLCKIVTCYVTGIKSFPHRRRRVP